MSLSGVRIIGKVAGQRSSASYASGRHRNRLEEQRGPACPDRPPDGDPSTPRLLLKGTDL